MCRGWSLGTGNILVWHTTTLIFHIISTKTSHTWTPTPLILSHSMDAVGQTSQVLENGLHYPLLLSHAVNVISVGQTSQVQ